MFSLEPSKPPRNPPKAFVLLGHGANPERPAANATSCITTFGALSMCPVALRAVASEGSFAVSGHTLLA